MGDHGHLLGVYRWSQGAHFRMVCGCGRGKSCPWLRLLSPFLATPCAPVWDLGAGSVQRHRKRWVSFIADAVAAVI